MLPPQQLVVSVDLLYELFINTNRTFCILASKGIGANMLKVGTKRRRTTAQIKAEKEEADIKETAIRERLANLER